MDFASNFSRRVVRSFSHDLGWNLFAFVFAIILKLLLSPREFFVFCGWWTPSFGFSYGEVKVDFGLGCAQLDTFYEGGLAVQVPAGGWTQILLYMGWCEVSRGPGSDIASGRPGRAARGRVGR